jgi:hypothetical protein
MVILARPSFGVLPADALAAVSADLGTPQRR